MTAATPPVLEGQIVSSSAQLANAAPEPETMHEAFRRPGELSGKTYKVSVGNDGAYVTINNVRLNPDTPIEEIRPFELFINSRTSEHAQWVNALTLMISAVWRKGGDYRFVAEKLDSIIDPLGGEMGLSISGERYKPSLVAEIGRCIAKHIQETCGYVKDNPRIADMAIVAAEETASHSAGRPADNGGTMPYASTCRACGSIGTLVRQEGCERCTKCGYDKCGG